MKAFCLTLQGLQLLGVHLLEPCHLVHQLLHLQHRQLSHGGGALTKILFHVGRDVLP